MFETVTSDSPPFFFVGNHPALDLLNTAPVEGGVPVERLVDYATLLGWLSQANLVSAADAKKASTRWAGEKEGRDALLASLALRAALHDVVGRISSGSEPSAAARARLNAELRRESGAFTEIVREGNAFASRRCLRLESAEDVLAPLYASVGDLFAKVDLDLVRKCEGAECVLFFHDTTKNHARRWCSMELCGNRNKVSAYRARTRV